jgi:hypothetical protein
MIRVKAVRRHWSGHGEGGTTAHVVYDKKIGNFYHATEEEHEQAEGEAQRINKLLKDAGL